MPAQLSGHPSESFPRGGESSGRRRGRGGGWWASFTRVARKGSRPLARAWRFVGRKTRFKVKLLTAVALLTAPVWGLNLVVAFLGHSVVFPFSPFFWRQKFAAVALYVRHRPACFAAGHENTDALVKRAETRHHIPRGLLAAVVHVESRGFPHRISAAGAMGPGQLMPDTARELGVDDPFDTAENVEGAAHLLAGHLAHFHNLRFAVAAYNAGAGAVRGRIPSNGQTPAYVEKVMQSYALLRPPPPPPAAPPTRQQRPTHRRPPRDRSTSHGRGGTALALTAPSAADE